MEAITAVEKVTNRLRPNSQICVRPMPETITSHAAMCPSCHRETRVGLGREATVYGSCPHFAGINQHGGAVSVLFDGEAAG